MAEREALEEAVASCQRALADYQAGLLDEGELRHELHRAGVVQGDAGAWLLDIEQGEWRQYLPVPADRAFDGATLGRWRAGLQQLLSESRD